MPKGTAARWPFHDSTSQARPGQLSFGAGGTGTPPHMAGELFKQMAGVNMLYVPYKGEAPAIADIMGGQISLIFSNVIAVLPQVQAGRSWCLRPS